MYIVHSFDIFMFTDPRTKDLFMLYDNPVYVWIITLVYILFVTVIGPRYMKNRPAFTFPRFLVVYNSILVVWSTYMFVEVSYSTLCIIIIPVYPVNIRNGRYRNFPHSTTFHGIDLNKNCLFTILVLSVKMNFILWLPPKCIDNTCTWSWHHGNSLLDFADILFVSGM